jgi:YVTN family beta-propeller protein
MHIAITRALSAAAAAGAVTLLGLAGSGTAGAAAAPAAAAKPSRPVTAYVANSYDGTVTAINTATGKVLKTIAVGFNDTVIAITPNGKTAYVANPNCGACMGVEDGAAAVDTAANLQFGVTPIDTATNKAGKKINVDAGEIAITPNGKTAYVANCCTATGNNLNTVTPIDTATNKPGKAIKVGEGPIAIAITRTGRPPTSPTSAAADSVTR